MKIQIALTLQRPPDLTGQRSNIALLDALVTPLDEIGALLLSIDLSKPATVALVLEFERSDDYDEPVLVESEASEWVGELLRKHLLLPIKFEIAYDGWKTLHFEPGMVPDEAEWRADQSLGSRPFS